MLRSAQTYSKLSRTHSVRVKCDTTTSIAQADNVKIAFRGREIEVPRGSKLRTALLRAGLTPHSEGAVYINCRGIGSCGTCAVEIQGEVQPASWTTAEQLRLNIPPHSAPGNQRLRLACQVACAGDLRLTKYDKFWGEGDTPLPDLPPTAGAAGGAAGEGGAGGAGVTPLGELEFVLDREAQRPEQR
ncbi:hypothetical protein HYH02_011952 [Chlamydomonas schloesseri]|uniref:2Fe-2S ferredoxin-type domain-containing protein n=1 Tax=Chlamydomonas schloesseri TaxID=2026947 RepID=A0A835T1T5_9CHLO|nr:hypothetical protein HYH02_011952 [Chlamydomonas schloesseri]|eukprot:KAG2435452.1 hypothetical protein HYH02_011952 [Chlamydomonas schloesseri]